MAKLEEFSPYLSLSIKELKEYHIQIMSDI